MSNAIEYNSDQESALALMQNFYVSSDDRMFLLKGYAGTGKSTVINELVKRLQKRDRNIRICYTAPTNKATKVLSQMAQKFGLNVDIMTTYQLLNIKPVINQVTGQQEFKPSDRRDKKRSMEDYDLIVVDESSMINKEVYGFLNDALPLFTRFPKIIFMGDPAQLPPVNEPESMVFQAFDKSVTLTQIMRYKGDIITLATAVRDNLLSNGVIKLPPTSRLDDVAEGIVSMPIPEWYKHIEAYFLSEEFKANPDHVRVLAYTNATVSNINQRIRGKLFGVNIAPFVTGDRLMAKSPCISGEEVILQNSSECVVVHVREAEYKEMMVWKLNCRTEFGESIELNVLKSEEASRLAYKLKGYAMSKDWKSYWGLKDSFHDVDYCYAMTIHKSQGSTFENVFVAFSDIFINRKIMERNQLFYVALTRASKKVFLYGY